MPPPPQLAGASARLPATEDRLPRDPDIESIELRDCSRAVAVESWIMSVRVRPRIAATALRASPGTAATTLGIGGAACPNKGDPFDKFSRNAARAPCASKTQGGNRANACLRGGMIAANVMLPSCIVPSPAGPECKPS